LKQTPTTVEDREEKGEDNAEGFRCYVKTTSLLLREITRASEMSSAHPINFV